MNTSVSDDAALEFAIGFYGALGAGKSIEDAFRFGCNAIALKNLPEDQIPVLKKSPDGVGKAAARVQLQSGTRRLYGRFRNERRHVIVEAWGRHDSPLFN